MKNSTPIAVASRSFSRHPVLREELLECYEHVRFNDDGLTLRGDALVSFATDCTKLIVGLEQVDDSLLGSLPQLEVVSKYGVGTDNLDMEALSHHGVRLGWTGGVNRRSVSELALGMMLALLRSVPAGHLDLRRGVWNPTAGRQLTGRTVGIVGCGYVGKDLITLLEPFGCHILAHDILHFPDFYATWGVKAVALEELLERSEIVSLHVPLTPLTRNLLNRQRLDLLRPDAILINTARGGIVDEVALEEALRTNRIAGAGFDVFVTEPPENLNLLSLPNFLPTAHIGGSTEGAILAMGRAAIEGLDRNDIPSPSGSHRTMAVG